MSISSGKPRINLHVSFDPTKKKILAMRILLAMPIGLLFLNMFQVAFSETYMDVFKRKNKTQDVRKTSSGRLP